MHVIAKSNCLQRVKGFLKNLDDTKLLYFKFTDFHHAHIHIYLGLQKLSSNVNSFEQIWIIHLRGVIMKSCVGRPLWIELGQNM